MVDTDDVPDPGPEQNQDPHPDRVDDLLGRDATSADQGSVVNTVKDEAAAAAAVAGHALGAENRNALGGPQAHRHHRRQSHEFSHRSDG